jgi:hypothetical protein
MFRHYRDVLWDFSRPGSATWRAANEAISGPQDWRCRQMEITSVGDIFSVCQTVESPRGQVGAARWVGWGPEMAVGAGRLLVLPGLGKSRRTLWQVPEEVLGLCRKYRTDVQRYPYAFLACIYLHSLKKITFWLSLLLAARGGQDIGMDTVSVDTRQTVFYEKRTFWFVTSSTVTTQTCFLFMNSNLLDYFMICTLNCLISGLILRICRNAFIFNGQLWSMWKEAIVSCVKASYRILIFSEDWEELRKFLITLAVACNLWFEKGTIRIWRNTGDHYTAMPADSWGIS